MLYSPLAAFTLLGSTNGVALNIVRMPIQRKPSPFLNRPVTFEEHWLPGGGYFAELAVGTPPQKVELLLDTGSSDLWVPSAQEPGCLSSECVGGSFDSARSSTYRRSTYQPFNISYGDNSSMFGEYALDTVTIGDCSLPKFSIAVATDVNDTAAMRRGTQMGILGLNSKEGKSECGRRHSYKDCTEGRITPTISEAMVTAGRIESNSYSLFLDDSNAQRGSILFGGVDTAKFRGPLTTLHVIPVKRGRLVRQQLRLASVAIHANDTAKQVFNATPQTDAALLDTGAGGLILPSDWVSGIYRDIEVPKILSTPGVPCDHDFGNRSLEFTLADAKGNSAQINVPLHELLVPLRDGRHNGTHPVTENGMNVCGFAVYSSGANSSSSHGEVILGENFFNSAYTFFNLEQHIISIAQAVSNPKSEHIVAIGKGPVPKLVGTA